ncbi:MAG: dihydroorotate dehydrogenase electron transfer subunit [Actinomycetales bacterium]|nr:MAG: dihydroorotate dehydrogenase electron transfer subunit [Actinomycetales bacterium]
MSGPVAVTGRLVDTRPAGAYRWLRIEAPEVARSAQPGQFVALAVGGTTSAHLLRRCFSIHRVDVGAGFVEIVVAAHGPGTVWLVGRTPGEPVEIAGPLGAAFPMPEAATPSVLVGGGYGSSPLFWLADELRARGCHVEFVLGAADSDHLFGVDLAGACADAVEVTTDDGSSGTQGWVTVVLPEVLKRCHGRIVYACGPMAMLRSITEQAAEAGAVAQVAVEEAMACGVGICMTCVLPVRRDDDSTVMVRSCLDGPVFRGDRVRWDAFADGYCLVPADTVGAPQPVGGH